MVVWVEKREFRADFEEFAGSESFLTNREADFLLLGAVSRIEGMP